VLSFQKSLLHHQSSFSDFFSFFISSLKRNKMNIQFFWDKKYRKLNRSRFNLLLLDYGEYFLEDFSAYHFPLPTNDLTSNFEIQDNIKVQGRLKLNSRSIIFEPNDTRYPLLKFPYRYIISELEKFHLTQKETGSLSIQVNGFLTFLCSQYHEMKAYNKIGPYKVIEYQKNKENPKEIFGYRLLFALVYADLSLFLVKIEQFRHIYGMSERLGNIVASQHLKPFLENALISSFDTSNLVDFHERFLIQTPISVRKIKPLVTLPGTLVITELRIYFQPAQLNNIGDTTQHFELKKVLKIYKRRHMLRSIGLEFLLMDGSSYFFVFDTNNERDKLYELLLQQEHALQATKSIHSSSTTSSSLSSPGPSSTSSSSSAVSHLPLQEITRKWQKHEITNFEYLMYLNNESGRTGNDLTQYPIFPHILSDYKSRKLDLTNPLTFRDLSKPIGALNQERLKYFKERFYSMPPAEPAMGIPPPFLYGTHYSTPGYVLFFLVRVAPEYMLCLQNGRFDAPDRMFHSIADMWESCLTNPTDLKELIPEFFIGSGEFLMNSDDLDLGHRYNGERLGDIELPPWAESTRDFIRKHAKALESEYVSLHLHEWIDLIFGFKQQGEEAIAADNLFYYLTYEGSVNLDAVKDVRERAALEAQIQEFGQTPRQLFKGPHPPRNAIHAPIVVTENVTESYEEQQHLSSAMPTPFSSLHSSSKAGGENKGEKEAMIAENTFSKNNNKSTEAVGGDRRSTHDKIALQIALASPIPQPPSTSRSTKSKSGKLSNTDDGEDVNDQIAIMHLGDDFRLEVERHLSSETSSPVNLGSSHSMKPSSFSSNSNDNNNNNNSRVSIGIGSHSPSPPPIGSLTSLGKSVDLSKMIVLPSEPYYWHSKAITGVTVRIHINEMDTSTNRRKLSATLCSIGKDSLLKVRASCLIMESFFLFFFSLSSLLLSFLFFSCMLVG
jgi:hypothetical protein